MQLVEEIRVPARHGKAFKIAQGQILRLTQKDGAQIIDFNAWNADNPREMFWCGRTSIIENAHPTTGHKLWSVEPWQRPMFTIHTWLVREVLPLACRERLRKGDRLVAGESALTFVVAHGPHQVGVRCRGRRLLCRSISQHKTEQ